MNIDNRQYIAIILYFSILLHCIVQWVLAGYVAVVVVVVVVVTVTTKSKIVKHLQ
jgi:hypothetical protein